MELLQLRYFITAATAENFTYAAAVHSVPTSDISQTIKRLERELGTALFVRSANRVVLSAEGRIFLESAERVINELEIAKRKITDSLQKVSGEIRMLVLTNRRVVTKAIEKYHSVYPDVNFIINHRANRKENFDIVISDTDPAVTGYTKCPLVTEKLYLAMLPKGNAVSEKKSSGKPDIAELSKIPFITMTEDSSHYRITLQICRENGFVPEIGIMCDDPYYIRKYTEMGLGAAFVPVFSWKGLLSEKLDFYEITNIKRTTYMYLSDRGKSSRAVNEFVPVLEECVKEDGGE